MIEDTSAVLAIRFSESDAATTPVQGAKFPPDGYHGSALGNEGRSRLGRAMLPVFEVKKEISVIMATASPGALQMRTSNE